MKKILIYREQLFDLYTNKKLTTFQIADKLGCCQATVWKRLRQFGIRSRLPGTARVNITKNQLEQLYLKQKLSTWRIEKKLNIPRSTIHRKLKEFSVPTRDISDSHIIYQKKNFSGNLLEKAYLIGFRIGDLGVRKQGPNSKTIVVATGSTIKEQIALVNRLFESYGHIWIKEAKYHKINIYVILNQSFDFLLSKEFPAWVETDKSLFFAFLAGFSDAEGTISIFDKRAYYSLGNYDGNLLKLIYCNLNRFGINCKKPTRDNRKGKLNSQGYPYRSNYWSLHVHKKQDLLRLLQELKHYIKHKNKLQSLNSAIVNIQNRNKIFGENGSKPATNQEN